MKFFDKSQFKSIDTINDGLGKTWYKILTYFGIWFGVLTILVIGILLITENGYLGLTDSIYNHESGYPALENTDFIYGIYRLIFAAFLVVTGFNMLKRTYDAPALLYGASIATVLSGFSYSFCAASNIVSSNIPSVKEGVLTTFTSPFSAYPIRPTVMAEFTWALYGVVLIVVSVGALVWNMIYFNNRDHWFAKRKQVKTK